MNIKLTLFVLFFNFISLWSQERYFVHAPNGLNVREEASANAAKVGKLPYGALVNILETTNINYEVTEEGKTFPSQWVKVKYENFPYINPKNPTYKSDYMGYVVQYYLEKLNKKSIVTHSIDSTTFYSLYKESIAPYKPTKITSFEEVKKIGISENEPIGVAEHIDLKYTDSGRVTANLKSPKMLDYSNRNFAGCTW